MACLVVLFRNYRHSHIKVSLESLRTKCQSIRVVRESKRSGEQIESVGRNIPEGGADGDSSTMAIPLGLKKQELDWDRHGTYVCLSNDILL